MMVGKHLCTGTPGTYKDNTMQNSERGGGRGGLGGHMAAWEAGSFNSLMAWPEISGAMAGSAPGALASSLHFQGGYPISGAAGSATMDGAWSWVYPMAIWMADSAMGASTESVGVPTGGPSDSGLRSVLLRLLRQLRWLR